MHWMPRTRTTALTSYVMNTDISSQTVLTEYLLQEHQCHTTRHTEIVTPDQAQGTTGKIEKVETDPDYSLDIADITAPAIMTCTEAVPHHNNGTGTGAIEAVQDDPIQHTGNTVTGHAMIHHTSHTTNPPHATAHQATTLRTTVDHINGLLTDCQNIVHAEKVHAV